MNIAHCYTGRYGPMVGDQPQYDPVTTRIGVPTGTNAEMFSGCLAWAHGQPVSGTDATALESLESVLPEEATFNQHLSLIDLCHRIAGVE